MSSLKELVLSARERLGGFSPDPRARDGLGGPYPQKEAQTIVGVLCRELLGVEAYRFLIEPDRPVEGESLERFLQAVDRLEGGEPLQYVLGYADFCGRRFNVGPSVLIPRPETEQLCSMVIQEALCSGKRNLRILDLCTGSGCMAWTLALSLPGSSVIGVDVSGEALRVASAQGFDCPEGCSPPRFIEADIFDDDALAPYGDFDILTANPPYILRSEAGGMRGNVLDHEPWLALFVPDDDFQVFNRKIAQIFVSSAKTDSVAYVEINDAVADGLEAVLASEGIRNHLLIKDFSGRNRFVKFWK